MLTRKKIPLIILSCSLFIMILAVAVIPSVMDYQAKHRIYENMRDGLDSILRTNIRLVDVERHDGSIAYGAGSSAVIIGKDDGVYYALTAGHVVNNREEIDYWLVITPDDPSVRDYKKEHDNAGQEDYYNQFPHITVEYINTDSDLAVVSFQTETDLPVVEVGDGKLSKGDRIASISNPEGQRFVRSYGKILSDHTELFKGDEDGLPETQTLRHNAYEAPGSSGSGVYNENMHLVGINIGGGTDFSGRFRYSVMVPAEQVNRCLNEWRSQQ